MLCLDDHLEQAHAQHARDSVSVVRRRAASLVGGERGLGLQPHEHPPHPVGPRPPGALPLRLLGQVRGPRHRAQQAHLQFQLVQKRHFHPCRPVAFPLEQGASVVRGRQWDHGREHALYDASLALRAHAPAQRVQHHRSDDEGQLLQGRQLHPRARAPVRLERARGYRWQALLHEARESHHGRASERGGPEEVLHQGVCRVHDGHLPGGLRAVQASEAGVGEARDGRVVPRAARGGERGAGTQVPRPGSSRGRRR
mmetsp:Transcript_18527/g.50252  ORF Transcript_18527/g.50252 Transcript_18527/m.50252 type:complete len:255 (+) Transcript_18527:168-932(+)